jgi:hypothetical protein
MAEAYKCGPCPIGYRGGVVMGVGYKHAMNKQVQNSSKVTEWNPVQFVTEFNFVLKLILKN